MSLPELQKEIVPCTAVITNQGTAYITTKFRGRHRVTVLLVEIFHEGRLLKTHTMHSAPKDTLTLAALMSVPTLVES